MLLIYEDLFSGINVICLFLVGGAGDFELIGLGNDQLHANTVPSHTTGKERIVQFPVNKQNKLFKS